MTVGVGRRKLSPVLLVLCIAGLLRSATAALNTPTCPAVLDAYTGGASSAKLNSGQQHTFSTTGVIQVRLNLTFGSDIDTNQVFFLFGAPTQCGGLIGDVTTGGNLRISVNCNYGGSDISLASGTGAVSPNTRYVIDYVYNQVTKLAEIYLDGVQIASGTKNWNEKVLDGYISVGDESHTSTVNAFQGTLHEVSMYDCGGRFTDKATLQSAVDACLLAVPSGCAEISDYDVSLVTDMSELFKDKADFNADISAWDTSQVTDMGYMFYGAAVFNGAVGTWDTSQVTDMWSMFRDAAAFDQAIVSWDTSQVENMNAMFMDAAAFNQPIGSWNTSQVKNTAHMFRDATSFNQAIGAWDTSQVTDMQYMFIRATSFNQDISSWSTSKVTDMNNMFKGAAAFYQDITGWTTTSLIYSTDMFTGTTAWLDRVQRGDGTGTSTDGPISEWVHKPCLRDERAQSGWCVPCEPNLIHIEGYDPAVGDTTCDEMTCCQAKMKRSGMIIKRKPKPKPNLNPHLSPYSCASDQGRVVFSLVDDNDVKDLPSTAAGIAAGFYNPNAFYIGNAELEAIDIKSAKMCLERSKARGDSECTTNCVDIVDSLFSCSPGSISSSGTKNMIMAMTGQLEPSTCAGYVFYNEGPGCDSSSTHCWSCDRTAKLGQTSSYNWHAHGWGMNLDRAGGTDELFHYPATAGECAEVYENGETFWDSFYIVVQE